MLENIAAFITSKRAKIRDIAIFINAYPEILNAHAPKESEYFGIKDMRNTIGAIKENTTTIV